MLDDGTYDAIVFDVDQQDSATVISLTVASGAHRGDVVEVRSDDLPRDPIELLGIPATITVVDGQPRVRFEP